VLAVKDRHFIVVLRLKEETPQLVVATRFEAHNDHLVFLDANGNLVALFVQDVVDAWYELNPD
jgi:hypothetical protein